jgi:hypothetical protein
MKLSRMLIVFAYFIFIGGFITIALGISFWPLTIGIKGASATFDTLISLAAIIAGASLILASLKMMERIKKARRP